MGLELELTTLKLRVACCPTEPATCPTPLFLVSQVFPPDEIEQVSNKDDMKTSLKKVVKEVGI